HVPPNFQSAKAIKRTEDYVDDTVQKGLDPTRSPDRPRQRRVAISAWATGPERTDRLDRGPTDRPMIQSRTYTSSYFTTHFPGARPGRCLRLAWKRAVGAGDTP